MGLIIDREIEPDCRLGLWEITEDYDTLLRTTWLADDDMRRLNSFRNLNRKVESLSVRALLQQMTGMPQARIVYHEKSHKPFLADGSYNISVSHSYRHTSILIAKNRLVGVDLEYMSHNIERLAHKFINQSDVITSDPQSRRQHLYVHWCAKEALFKICDKIGINFKENLIIRPFNIASEGDITGVVRNNQRNETYKMHYRINHNYAWVYCLK